MPIIPVRGLAAGGIVLDQHPTALPISSYTNGRNVLFESGKLSRAPLWRLVKGALPGAAARHCAARSPASGFAEIIVCRDDASLVRLHDDALTESSETGFVAHDYYDAPWSSVFLGDVLYVNRPDQAPRALKPSDDRFIPLAHWPSGWTCRVLRSFRDSLVALGPTKNGVDYPSTVTVSDVAYYETVPTSWDVNDAATIAYETPLARMTGPILDGQQLGERFLIYGADQVVEMTADSNFLYSFVDLPFKDGTINTNCVVEIDGSHFVFGSRDIWMTDGQSKKSLAENRVRDALYRRIDFSKRNRCFVQFDPVRNLIFFCYVSSNSEAAWQSPTGCNEAMVYSRSSDTWTIVDLPNVVSMTVADINTAKTWDTIQGTWDSLGGSWYDLEDGRNRHLVSLSQPLQVPNSVTQLIDTKLLAYDYIDKGRLALQIEPTAIAPSFIERTGITLDAQQDGGVPLRTSKLIKGIIPEISVSRPIGAVIVYPSAVPTAFATPSYDTAITFWPAQDYVVDCMIEGRFLAIKTRFPDDCDSEFSGFDLDVTLNGRR